MTQVSKPSDQIEQQDLEDLTPEAKRRLELIKKAVDLQMVKDPNGIVNKTMFEPIDWVIYKVGTKIVNGDMVVFNDVVSNPVGDPMASLLKFSEQDPGVAYHLSEFRSIDKDENVLVSSDRMVMLDGKIVASNYPESLMLSDQKHLFGNLLRITQWTLAVEAEHEALKFLVNVPLTSLDIVTQQVTEVLEADKYTIGQMESIRTHFRNYMLELYLQFKGA